MPQGGLTAGSKGVMGNGRLEAGDFNRRVYPGIFNRVLKLDRSFKALLPVNP